MKRRSFLAMLGLAPVAGAAVAKGLMPLPPEAKAAAANFRMNTNAGPHGYRAGIGLEARVGSAGVYRSASFFLDVPAGTGPTRIVLDADKFRIGSVDAHGHILIEEV